LYYFVLTGLYDHEQSSLSSVLTAFVGHSASAAVAAPFANGTTFSGNDARCQAVPENFFTAKNSWRENPDPLGVSLGRRGGRASGSVTGSVRQGTRSPWRSAERTTF
jgi:hypothetical protein